MELGCSEVYLSRRLTAQVAFNVTDLYALARALDVPVAVFFDVPDEVHRSMGYAKPARPDGSESGNLRFSTPLRAAA